MLKVTDDLLSDCYQRVTGVTFRATDDNAMQQAHPRIKKQSETVWSNMKQSEAIWSSLKQALCCTTNQLVASWSSLKHFEAVWSSRKQSNKLKQSETKWSPTNQPEASWRSLKGCEVVWSNMRSSLKTDCSSLKQYEEVGSNTKHSKAPQTSQKDQ